MLNAKDPRKRTKAYRDLLGVTEATVGYARAALPALSARGDATALLLSAQITRHIGLAEAVIDQTERRVFYGESVDAADKILSKRINAMSLTSEMIRRFFVSSASSSSISRSFASRLAPLARRQRVAYRFLRLALPPVERGEVHTVRPENLMGSWVRGDGEKYHE